jgi:hypothetical protein
MHQKEAYEQLKIKLNKNLNIPRKKIDFKNVKEKSICIGFDKNDSLYYRLQIMKIEKDQVNE